MLQTRHTTSSPSRPIWIERLTQNPKHQPKSYDKTPTVRPRRHPIAPRCHAPNARRCILSGPTPMLRSLLNFKIILHRLIETTSHLTDDIQVLLPRQDRRVLSKFSGRRRWRSKPARLIVRTSRNSDCSFKLHWTHRGFRVRHGWGTDSDGWNGGRLARFHFGRDLGASPHSTHLELHYNQLHGVTMGMLPFPGRYIWDDPVPKLPETRSSSLLEFICTRGDD